MKRILSVFAAAVLVGVSVFLYAAPALAQTDYEYTYDSGTDATTDAVAGSIGIFMWVVTCCSSILCIVVGVLSLISLVHCIQHAPADQKTLWIILILLVPFAGLVYFFTKRKQWSGESK